MDWGRTPTGPEIGDLTGRVGTPPDPGVLASGTAAPWGQANKYLTKNQVNTLHSEATEGGQPRINLNHLKPAANTGSEREEPKVRLKKTAGTWTIQRPEYAAHEPKAVTNHERQPRPPSQPTNAWDTSGQKHTHPKVREGKQGTSPSNQADTTATGAPWHRVHNPAYPCKQAEQEKHRKRREGLKPNPRHQGSRRTDTRWPENP